MHVRLAQTRNQRQHPQLLSALVQEQRLADLKQYNGIKSNIESLGRNDPVRQGRPVAKVPNRS